MNRRATLAALMGRTSKSNVSKKAASSALLTGAGLEPYTGVWDAEKASHLLRRAMFGPNKSQIAAATADGMNATVDLLMAPQPLPGPPLNQGYEDDPNVPIGETWIDAPLSATVNLKGYRTTSLRAWSFENIYEEGVSVREKMCLFWHNHLVIQRSNVNDPRFNYIYLTTLREFATGNFKQLIKDITIDPSMLRYLNGNQNTRNAPNENYARELMELFTLGKGDLAGPGDYTTFTEDDVIQVARALTGWRFRGYNSVINGAPIESYFTANRHDTGDKQLSHRFNNTIISDGGEDEYKDVVDIIFQRPEVARFICRKLYRWFVYYVIDDEVEANVIEPMAQILEDNDYEIAPALDALLRSAHFYEHESIGPMIKNPIDFVLGAMKQTEFKLPEDNLALRYGFLGGLGGRLLGMQMEYLEPPNVAGWKAYYQVPSYYQTWINAVTLPDRMSFTDDLTQGEIRLMGVLIKMDVLTLIEDLPGASDPDALVDGLVKLLFPQPITDNQKEYLKEFLTPGLPDFVWTNEYGDYLVDPSDPALIESVDTKLRSLIKAMMNMPEYFLS